jgi:hypothetical protein
MSETLCSDERYAELAAGLDPKLLPTIEEGNIEEWAGDFCRAFPDIDSKVMAAWVYRIASDFFDAGRG